MGLLLLLRFSLLCLDFLAWPVIALGYPLFASIRAIETGSVHHLKKLVIYWTLFSIITLLEYVLVNIIEWVPFWSSIKLAVIFWLVIPRFQGAHYAYKYFVRPYMVVNVEEAINRFNKRNEEQQRAKENGSECLEKLIASKVALKEHDNSSQRDSQVIKLDERSIAAASKQKKEPGLLEAPEKIASTEAKQFQVNHPRPITSACWVPKETTYTTAKDKDIITLPEYTQNKVEHAEWTCPLCQVTTTCEKNLGLHLQGKKHKSMCESLKISKIDAQDTGSLSVKLNQNKVGDACEQKEDQGSSSNKPKPGVALKYIIKENESEAPGKVIAKKLKKIEHAEWTCSLCQVTTTCEKNLNLHLQGKKHKSMCEPLDTNKLNAHSESGV